ncbi:hypothetical protein F4677DRAFT_431724 [Hypoxylon crocopeplum]|nr:hypothetical protein F4677DRAFT_431724 [Hypoxylon crocopeplum]
MDGKHTRGSRIEIPLSSKPRPYRPGDGPQLAPITLAPIRDSTAFILDKSILPDHAPKGGEMRLLVYYVISWTDLPAARLTIPATRAYEYVSPRVVEDFEHQALLRRDEAERQEAEIPGAQKKSGTPAANGKKKRGRPSKADIRARQLDNSRGIEVPGALPPAPISRPSLRKGAAADITSGSEDTDEADVADANDAIYRQLHGEDAEPVEEMDVDGDEEEDMPLDNVPKTILSGKIRPYATTLWLNKDSTLFKRANGMLALKSSTTPVPVPEMPQSNTHSQAPSQQLAAPVKQANSQPYETPVPVPPAIRSDTIIPVPKPKTFDGRLSTTPIPVPKLLKSVKNIIPKPLEARHSTTPVPLPSWPLEASARSAPPASISSPDPTKTTLQHHGFTPAGRSSGRWPSVSPQSPNGITAAIESPLNGHDHTEHSKKKLKPNPKEGQVWVVERLVSDTTVEVDGKPAQYFKVRWEGNWPPDQNPTWEPEENIAPNLVKQYLKKKASRQKATSPAKNDNDTPSMTLPRRPQTLKRKYSSVAEAFAGDETVWNKPEQNGRPPYEESGDEVLVVAKTHRRRRSEPKLSLEDLGAVFMRDLATASIATKVRAVSYDDPN